ncbi:hypothetical protein ASPCADRAFT_403905 [Aspergillus carbonarius ITEM 5010]|uniref:2EXR domain-containing protein n=1 Tax=Aspergillus carbonarius (strain ITEM 5010) TaxID=602072 RepID=A0A1R3RUD9_ASPC5|nr:hypothetical protein ASPCADRAFT_403905 [Aspergillus carbonarius ITEM 5010]
MFDTFHLFPLLPPELRLQIWSSSFLHARDRVVKVSCRRYHYRRRYSWYFCAEPPVQLHVNREARNEALRLYRRFFCIEPTLDSAPHSYVYLAPERDIVHVNENALRMAPVTEQKQLRRVILDVNYKGRLDWFPWKILPQMEQLEEIELVIWLMPEGGQSIDGHDIYEYLQWRLTRIAKKNPEWQLPHIELTLGSGERLGGLKIRRS